MSDEAPFRGPRLTPSFRPRQVRKTPPCQDLCPNCGDIRAWIGTVAQRGKTGLRREEAYAQAWRTITDVNPFPSVLGRICPHPCESNCNRSGYDGALAINAMERFLGDWGIENGLSFPRVEDANARASIGVVGSGPSGLSFAYQMARRGYPVVVYEEHPRPGGMLRYGVPDYRLPSAILDAEIQRIVDLGVALRLDTRIGRDITLAELRERHVALYLGLGAQAGRKLGIPGEDGPSVWTGIDYLEQVKRRLPTELGKRVTVVGGGNTAVDAARTARRSGADVTIVYRRSREEMPAIPAEIEEALEEGISLLTFAMPTALLRSSQGALEAVACLRMQPGEPDAAGRRRPVVIADSEFSIATDSLIAAVSQTPLLDGLSGLRHSGSWLVADDAGYVDEGVLAGGDTLGLGIAGNAIVQGRRAAERLHAQLSGGVDSTLPGQLPEVVGPDRIQLDHKPPQPRARVPQLPATERVSPASPEVSATLSEAAFLAEVDRCYSCGDCLGCEQCAMYCTKGSFVRLAEAHPGMYFSLALDACEECGKCIAVCPSGYLEPTPLADR